MNFEFCRVHCNGMCHPNKVVRTIDGKYFLYMDEHRSYEQKGAGCSYAEVEDLSEWFAKPPKGCFVSDNTLYFETCDPFDVLWNIKLKFCEGNTCPYLTEHAMYDWKHASRKRKWREKEEARKKLIETRKEEANAERKELS